MKFRGTRGLVLVCILAAGCATPSLEPAVSERIRSRDIGAAVVLLDKSIQYHEMVYKVLWNETRSHSSTFEGFWDVDKELTSSMVGAMGEVGIKARPISSALNEKQYSEFVTSLKQTRASDGTNAPLALGPSARRALKKAGIGSVAVIRSSKFFVSTTSMNSTGMMNIPSVLIVYDLERGTQEYLASFPIGGGIKWGDSVRNIESDNLKILREASPDWVKASVRRQMPKVFSLAR